VLPAAGLRLEVAPVRGGDVDAGRQLLDHGHAVGAELSCLVGVVAQEGDPGRAERMEHLRGGHVAALVLAVTQGHVRVIRVGPGVLQGVRVELRVEPDAASLLAQIEQVAAGFGDALDGLTQLRSAVAALAAEHVAGEALAVRADQRQRASIRREGGRPVAEREGEVLPPSTRPSKLKTRASVTYPSARCSGTSTFVRIVAAGSRMILAGSLMRPRTGTKARIAAERRRRAAARRRAPPGGPGSRGTPRPGRISGPRSRRRRPARPSVAARPRDPP
jgi:hypothetical protein